jgi:hypothetical protein
MKNFSGRFEILPTIWLALSFGILSLILTLIPWIGWILGYVSVWVAGILLARIILSRMQVIVGFFASLGGCFLSRWLVSTLPKDNGEILCMIALSVFLYCYGYRTGSNWAFKKLKGSVEMESVDSGRR